MPQIIIQGNIINFPNSSADPNWSEAIIQFAEAVELALSITAGTYDVGPQLQNIDNENPGTNVDIPALSFPVSQVRSAVITYAVVRSTSTTNLSEEGEIQIVYNIDNPVGNKWEISQTKLKDAQISFSITDTGQMQFTTTAVSGTNHTGSLMFSARALQNSY